MDNNWAAVHLETIRTLMERSALYRRALAPISTFVGLVGILAAIIGWAAKIDRTTPFALYWITVGLIAVVGGLMLVRRQAVSQGEVFWSPPMRRVAQAMFPALLTGLVLTFLIVKADRFNQAPAGSPTAEESSFILGLFWTMLYGLALHAAGFFMPRGIRLFGWGFLVAGLILLASGLPFDTFQFSPHLLMGVIFGASHLAYGVYLYFTEPRKSAA